MSRKTKTTTTNNKRKRDINNTAGIDTSTTTTTSLAQETDKPMAPAQDTNNDKKQGNDLEGRDFYEVLGIKRDATQKEITIAYRKLATKIHPDKNREDPFANDKFQTLGKIHMTLSDPEKRKIYDETGETSDDTGASFGETDWQAYFNLIFKRVTKNDIRDFAKKYRGSDAEKKDVLEAYTQFKGNMKKVMDVVMVSRDEDLGRFATMCQQAVDAGEVKAYPGFKKFEKHVGKDLEIKDVDEDEIPKDLVASFAQRKAAFDDLTARLEARYGNKGAESGDKKKKAAAAPASRTKRGVVGMKKKRVGAQKKKVKEVEEEEEEEDDVILEEGEEMEA